MVALLLNLAQQLILIELLDPLEDLLGNLVFITVSSIGLLVPLHLGKDCLVQFLVFLFVL